MAKADTQNAKGDIWWQSARTFGQKSNSTTRRLARMNLAIRDFSHSTSNEVPRPWERERMSAGQVRVEGENPINAERARVRWRIPRNADSFRQDLHPDLKADFILANPPFNMSDWGGENLRQDVRWKFGMPPANNANYAWIQHFIHHLSPVGVSGFVMANGSV